MIASQFLLILATAFVPCELKRLYFISVTGILLKDGDMLHFTSKKEFEDLSEGSQLEDVCNKLRDTISSNIDKPYEAVGCSVSSLSGYPEINHVIVKLETTGLIESQNFASELFAECEKRMTNLNIMDLNLQQPFSAVNNKGHTTIRIAVRFVGDDSTGEWHSAYGRATEVMHTAEATCSKFTKRANTKKISDDNNSTCTVTGPQRRHVKGEFLLYFELDETDAIKATKADIEKRNITKIGYDIRDLQIEFPSPTR